ncbi:P-loop containing nucleoside triphosphate hydrolase protein [Phlegmacium glaucopus]|nr:P-loop containing nucleoside triphosphate hydrolase protein [Phlegmacium glaucopus]
MREQEAKHAADLARAAAKQAEGEELQNREKEANEKEAEARRATKEVSYAKKHEIEARELVLEAQRREEVARLTAVGAREKEEEAQKCLELVLFRSGRLGASIQPEVWPTEEEYRLAKKRMQYDPEKVHFAICGSSGSGKSSLVNAFRGLKNKKPNAAPTGTVETTMAITRYPDPREEMPYKRLVWYDCPGAGTLRVPGWQYFNEQGLFIFDVVILVYDTRFTEIDLCIIRNCERFKIPLFIVRSKADSHIQNILDDLDDDENDDDAEVNHEEQARQFFIDTTRNNVETNLKEAGLSMHDIFIVSSSVIYSLVTNSRNRKKTTPVIDEARLIETVLKTAYARRYGTQAPAEDHSSMIDDSIGMVTDSPQLALISWV